ncbi:uncharacterized protein EV420DRAFT_1544017 [Desarmillaria tabescens]|uniref:Uncharacterized protein n=1 Tax=Armillaria tabescens TaxID=1929756 RepID=A0AA39KBM9_ARMTA|nr:uncharacterized protein EV420DRAFT_1544017 [Desarmillaria tabescens]KAK0458182.1 hypothetical protein EV420DRAFT_1544017 [Desarmillaria tabescens]
MSLMPGRKQLTTEIVFHGEHISESLSFSSRVSCNHKLNIFPSNFLILPQESALRGSMDEQPQLIGPLQLCFNLKKNGAYIRVDQSVETELTSLATELLGTKVGDERNRLRDRLRKKLLSICDGWTVMEGKTYLRDYPKPKKVEPIQTLQPENAGNGEGNANINNFIDIVFSPPWRGTVPSVGCDQWRNQLLDLLQSMNVRDREIACQRVPSLVRVELVKPRIRAEYLDLLDGTNIEKHDISNWYAIPIELQNPCKLCTDNQFLCTWSRGPDDSKRCRECILANRNRCLSKATQTGHTSNSHPKKRSMTSDDSDYKGRIDDTRAFLPLPTTRRADKELSDGLDAAVCGQKRPSSPSSNSVQSLKRLRTEEGNVTSSEIATTTKTLFTDDDFQDGVRRILHLENAIKEMRKENEELWRANDSWKEETEDLKAATETTLKKLKCLQADITHVDSLVSAMR